MEQIARLSQVFHLRMALVITLLTGLDLVGLYACVRHVIRNGPSMAILFGNEVCKKSLNIRKIYLVCITPCIFTVNYGTIHAERNRYATR